MTFVLAYLLLKPEYASALAAQQLTASATSAQAGCSALRLSEQVLMSTSLRLSKGWRCYADKLTVEFHKPALQGASQIWLPLLGSLAIGIEKPLMIQVEYGTRKTELSSTRAESDRLSQLGQAQAAALAKAQTQLSVTQTHLEHSQEQQKQAQEKLLTNETSLSTLRQQHHQTG